MATGVLVLCLGRATRLVSYVQQQPKTYAARFLLGCRSNTDDTTGDVTPTRAASEPVSRQRIEELLPAFVGCIEQVPPQFSAVHVSGQRAYKRARRGETVPILPRRVTVHRLTITTYQFPELDLEIECGSGTYVRSIGRDLGEQLGIGAVMSRLVRTRIGPFTLESATKLDELERKGLDTYLLPPSLAVCLLPNCTCSLPDLDRIRVGRPIAIEPDRFVSDSPAGLRMPTEHEMVAVLSPDGSLACIAEYQASSGQLAPKNVFLTE